MKIRKHVNDETYKSIMTRFSQPPEFRTGYIRFTNDKGFGFIRDEVSREEVYFHGEEVLPPEEFGEHIRGKKCEYILKVETSGKNRLLPKGIDINILPEK